jgi:hypothetical protein
VAYFDMDSIEANFVLWKQVQAEVVKREAGINDTINQMKMGFKIIIRSCRHRVQIYLPVKKIHSAMN